jgi:hypothetical protein
MKTIPATIAIVMAASCGGGDELQCGGSGEGGDSLDGSYCEDVPIRFTSAEVRRQNSGGDEYFIFVRYVDANANTVEPRKVLEILLPSSAVVIAPNTEIRIKSVQGATVRRFPSAEEGSIQAIDLTPELGETSQVTFTEFTGEIDSNAAGEFGFFFEGSGRTLNGTFAGPIIENRPE